jgi:hypothetical protein
MRILATMPVSELKELIKEEFNASVDVYTTSGNIAGDNRKIKALCSNENIAWPINIETKNLTLLKKKLARELGLNISIVSENTDSQKSAEKSKIKNPNKKFTIKIGGRISKYFFGFVKNEIAEEIELAIPLCRQSLENSDPLLYNEDIETSQDFLRFFLCNTLENAKEDQANFRNRISISEFENACPKLHELFISIENENWNHFQLYDALFEPIKFKENSMPEAFIPFFESDASIEIFDDENNEILPNTSLENFSEITAEYYSTDTDLKENQINAIKLTNDLVKKYSKNFELNEIDDMSINLNARNSIFISNSMVNPVKDKYLEDRKNAVTIEHDDFADYYFQIHASEFSCDKLLFLSYPNAQDFRESSSKTVLNYLFYDNELILPEEKWYRDKGITLKYEDIYQDIDFLINA